MKHRLGTAALAMAALLAATACGLASDSDAAVVSDPLPAVDDPMPVDGPDDIGDGKGSGGADHDPAAAKKVEAYPGGTVQTRARPWEQVEPNGDQTELTVFWWSGVAPCTVLDRVEVEETDDAVTITIYEGAAADNPDAMCIQIAEYHAYTVELEGELGARSVIDGAAQ
ncbi:MAG TPA: hypothetical protein VGA36_06665 [Nitriliruptorales bacterium]